MKARRNIISILFRSTKWSEIPRATGTNNETNSSSDLQCKVTLIVTDSDTNLNKQRQATKASHNRLNRTELVMVIVIVDQGPSHFFISCMNT
jgi:hypothetical protein